MLALTPSLSDTMGSKSGRRWWFEQIAVKIPWFGRVCRSIWPCEHIARVPLRPQLLHVNVRHDDSGMVVRFFSEIYTCNQGLGDIWDAWVKGLLILKSSKLSFALHALEFKTNQHKNAATHFRLGKWGRGQKELPLDSKWGHTKRNHLGTHSDYRTQRIFICRQHIGDAPYLQGL